MDEIRFYDILGQTKISFGDINNFPHYPTQDASGLPIFPEGSSITTEEFKIRYDEIEKDYSINRLRIERNVLLAESDWTQLNDVKLSNIDHKIVSYLSVREARAKIYRLGLDLFLDQVIINWANDKNQKNQINWRALYEVGKNFENSIYL